MPSLRVGDTGIHGACCGPNQWTATTGCNTVLINGKPAHRQNDMTQHCGGVGRLIVGSCDVVVGDCSASGAGGGPDGNGASAGGGGKSPESCEPDSSTTETKSESPPPEKKPPKKAPATWCLVYPDGSPVRGFRSRLLQSSQSDEQELYPDGSGRNQLSSLDEDEGFHVTPVGTIKVSGQVNDCDGKPLARAHVQIVRAFGPPIDVYADGSGKFEAEGLLEDEPCEVVVKPAGSTIDGKFVDERGKAVAVRAAVWLDRSRVVELPVSSDGRYSVPGRPPGDCYDLLFVACTLTGEGRFVDEAGLPIAEVRARVRLSSGRTVEVTSDADGRYRIEGLMPEECYSLEILSGTPK